MVSTYFISFAWRKVDWESGHWKYEHTFSSKHPVRWLFESPSEREDFRIIFYEKLECSFSDEITEHFS